MNIFLVEIIILIIDLSSHYQPKVGSINYKVAISTKNVGFRIL